MDEEKNQGYYEDTENLCTDDLFIKRSYDMIPVGVGLSEEERLRDIIARGELLKMRYYDRDFHNRGVSIVDYYNACGLPYAKVLEAEKELRKLEEIKKQIYNNYTKDYSGTDCFWSYRIMDDESSIGKYTLKTVNNRTRQYYSIQSLNDDFISLIEFLNKAKYVGRYFKIIKGPSYDYSYLDEDKRCFLLYMYDNIAICRVILDDLSTDDYVEEYRIISSLLLKDGYYEFYGDCIESFDDRQAVYNEIFNQVYDHNPSYEEKSRIKQ